MSLKTFELHENVPFDVSKAGFPIKCIKNVHDMSQWQVSEAYISLLGFINGISYSVQGFSLSDEVFISDTMSKLLHMFDVLNKLLHNYPPIDQPQRFGNKAFRDWYHQMHQDIYRYIDAVVPPNKCDIIMELGNYFTESFGNPVRIDYGTGHELSFIFFLCALYKAEILNEKDNPACALRLFNTYLKFVRNLQQLYRMEPAGSQGVWSLDDYQFVPFIWGSAQLAIDAPFEPIKFLDLDIIERYKDEYMFISCIDYICQVKTGHFAEHSNQLWSISAVESWAKISMGLVKMYQKEILSKYPIMQHVLFGSCMKFKLAAKPQIQSFRLGMRPPRSSTDVTLVSEEGEPEVEVEVEREGETEIEEDETTSYEESEEMTSEICSDGLCSSNTSGVSTYSSTPSVSYESFRDLPNYTPRVLKKQSSNADSPGRKKVHILAPGVAKHTSKRAISGEPETVLELEDSVEVQRTRAHTSIVESTTSTASIELNTITYNKNYTGASDNVDNKTLSNEKPAEIKLNAKKYAETISTK